MNFVNHLIEFLVRRSAKEHSHLVRTLATLLAQIKIIEEPELEKRFGQAYLEYKKETPFIIPKLRSKKQV